jgi:outer membrane protein assembly factor BamB
MSVSGRPFYGGVWSAALLLASLALWSSIAIGSDWPQYRGANFDGVSPDPILTTWPAAGPTVAWTNPSLTNGFSSFAISQGRAFAMVSKADSSGQYYEYCAAVDAVTGANLWSRRIDDAPWDPQANYNGGDGAAPYNTGDGPRATPSVGNGRVVALSGLLHLVCLNATNGTLIWSNDLASSYGASVITWENAASPCLDNDLIYVNLHTSTNNQTLAAFRLADGAMAWSSQNENMTHVTPIVATIQGVRQVIFATQTGLVSLDRTTGAFLWKYIYPFAPIGTSMAACPLVFSNIVYVTAAYFRGAAAFQVTYSGGAWHTNQLWFKSNSNYRSIWMSPVLYQGYVYTLCGENSTFLTTPLNCIELSTGTLKWSVNGFGMGGLILAGNNLVILTEDGQLVLAQPNPNAYTELARYQAFHFDDNSPGKCWNSPAFSNGRIYARSTSGSICLDVSVPPALKMLTPRFLNSTQLQLTVSTVDGTPIASNRLPKIEVHATNALGSSPFAWTRLTNPIVLGTNGQARLTNTIAPGQTRQFYAPVEQP